MINVHNLVRYTQSCDSFNFDCLLVHPLLASCWYFQPILLAIKSKLNVNTKWRFTRVRSCQTRWNPYLNGLVLILSSLRLMILFYLHFYHLGVDKMKSRTSLAYWWSWFDRNIVRFSKSFGNCGCKPFPAFEMDYNVKCGLGRNLVVTMGLFRINTWLRSSLISLPIDSINPLICPSLKYEDQTWSS